MFSDIRIYMPNMSFSRRVFLFLFTNFDQDPGGKEMAHSKVKLQRL